MKKKFTFLGILAFLIGMVFNANAQTFFTEDFENGGTFPSGWTLTPGTGDDWAIDDGTYYGPGSAHSGSYTAMFDDWDYSSGTTAQMITPAIDLSSTAAGDIIVLSYWYWDGDGSDQVEVLASTDGTNFTPIDTTASTVDPWTQQFVNLSAYAGQATVYISFKGTSVYGSTNPNVDDIIVKKISANDLAATVVYLPTPYCGMTTDTIRMSIVNVGTAAQNNYDATYSIDGGATWITPENITTTLNPGDTLNYTFTTLADFSTPGTYNVMAAVVLTGDQDNNNDTAFSSITIYPTITTLSYTENFDANSDGAYGNLANNWIATPDAVDGYTFGWRTETTTTGSSNTGPSGPASGTGAYVYLETSGGNQGDMANLVSPCLDLSGITNQIILTYSYHMYGATMGNLYTDVMIGGAWQCIDTIQGQQQTADTDPWLLNVLPLSNTVEKIRFRGERGSSYTGDMAIDDILIKEMLANNLAATAVYLPTPYCGMTTDTIRMSIVNVGTAAQNNYNATYSIDGGATWITPENITTTLNPGDTLNYTFTTLADFSTPGTYNVMAAVVLTGDQDNNNDTIIGGSVVSTPIISSYPYTQDFEGTQYWTSGGTNSSWELGTPANTVINSAASGTNAWVTNLTGSYNSNEDSYVESPCFDFSTLHNPLVQFNYWLNSENGWDGAALNYSIDGGATWVNVGILNDWMNWYNDASISGLPADGWTGDRYQWEEAKHLLTSLAGQPSVKFRIVFGSDGSVQNEGFAFDDFTIREGEVNLAITEINYNGPESGTDTTEFIEWYNYGQDAINVDGYYYSQGVTDTLPNLLVLPGDFFVSAYDSTVMANFFGYTGAIKWDAGGLSNGGEDIALHTSWGATVDSVWYDDGNGWPSGVGSPDGYGPSLVFCEQNIGLDANDPANWNISTSFAGTINGTDVFASPGALDSACLSWDVAIAEPQTGDTISDCSFTATDTVMIPLTNVGNQVIPAGDTIYGWYQRNTDPVVADTMVLNADFNPGDTIMFMFNQTIDLSALGYYSGGLWFNYFNDFENTNDTAYITLNHYEPVVDLGPDTIWTAQPDTVVLDAGSGFDSYLWQDNSTMQTFHVNTAGIYYVSAMDSNGCSASDTIVVELITLSPDITFANPQDSAAFSDCDLSANDTIEIALTNLGGNITAPDTIYLWYQIDGGTAVGDTLFLSADFNTNDTVGFQFNQTYDFSAIQTYNFKLWLTYVNDTLNANDTVVGTLTNLGVDLGPDTICTSQPDTIVLDAGAGFSTYVWSDGSTNQTYNVIVYGTYYVNAYDSTSGCDMSDTIVITNCVGINKYKDLAFSIYPNPNNGTFTVELPEYTNNVRIEVLDIQGEVIYNDLLLSNRNNINISNFAKGVYFVKLTSDKSQKIEKIIIQ